MSNDTIKPLLVLEIYEGDITAEADGIQEGIELSKDQIRKIMEKVKDTLRNEEFFDEYFAVVRDCVESEILNE